MAHIASRRYGGDVHAEGYMDRTCNACNLLLDTPFCPQCGAPSERKPAVRPTPKTRTARARLSLASAQPVASPNQEPPPGAQPVDTVINLGAMFPDELWLLQARQRAFGYLALGVLLVLAGSLTLWRASEHGGIVWSGAIVVGALMLLRAIRNLWRIGRTKRRLRRYAI